MRNESNSKPALDAMHRAAIKVIEKVAYLDLEIPEWRWKNSLCECKEKTQKASLSLMKKAKNSISRNN